MALEPGTRVGVYEVSAKIGEGGMGEVYQARDTKLDRDVALKVLPDAFTADAERLARFEREAKVLASLNHPNIGGIHGLEESGEVRALVLELVEGPTLAERIARGPIPVDEALPIAKQIAEAFEAAHEHGVIHRDLKPANIKVRRDGTVKVLDFGLAKAFDPESGSDPSASPTVTAATLQGVILGTAAYMSPEQASGKPVDKRSDIWAFGAVLFEMLTSTRAFDGETVSHVLAAVLSKEVNWVSVPEDVPDDVTRLLRRCLERDAARRLRDVGEARIVLSDSISSPSPAAALLAGDNVPLWNRPIGLVWLAATAILVSALWLAAGTVRNAGTQDGGAGAPALAARAQVTLPPGVRMPVDTALPVLALSPDGSRLAFVGEQDGIRRLYTKSWRDAEARVVQGSEGAGGPFFSPDGAWVGFIAGFTFALKRAPVTGGTPVPLFETTPVGVSRGAAWVGDSVVMALSSNGGLALGPVSDETAGLWSDLNLTFTPLGIPTASPSPIGNESKVLYTRMAAPGNREIAAVSVETGEVQVVINGGSSPRYSRTGHLLFSRGGTLYSVPYDSRGGTAGGPERELLSGILHEGYGAAHYAVGGSGILAYVAGGELSTERELVWVDRTGDVEEVISAGREYVTPRLSPDGMRVAVAIRDANTDIWEIDLARSNAERRLTTHQGEDFDPVWNPDGTVLAFASEIGEDNNEIGPALTWMPLADERPEQLYSSPPLGSFELPGSWSPDGDWLAFTMRRPGRAADVFLLPTSEPHDPVAFVDSEFNERGGVISPRGDLLAYVSDRSALDEVYVSPFPDGGPGRLVSTDGGDEPVWSKDGRELFYRAGNRMMAVDMTAGAGNEPGVPRELFSGAFQKQSLGGEFANYDVSPDGDRFLMVRGRTLERPDVIEVVFDWPTVLLGADGGAAVR